MNPDPIKKRIQELCPDVMEYDSICPNPDCGVGFENKITLAVVLRAIEKIYYELDIYTKDAHYKTFGDLISLWNLEQDNYDQQSGECKQFIGSLLNA